MKRTSRFGVCRRGATAVEFAAVLPVIVIFIVGGIELGRGLMVQHILEEAARAGCRIASLDNRTKQDVLDVVGETMKVSNCRDYTVTMDPDPPINLTHLQHVKVTVSVAYEDIGWVDFGLLSGMTLTGTCIMPAEVDSSDLDDRKNSKNKKANKKGTKEGTKKGS